MINGIKLVCFDIGGVLVRICYRWREACSVAGVVGSESAHLDLTMSDFGDFDRLQHGQLAFTDYCASLREFLGLESLQAAEKVHQSILVDSYPGVLELVIDLKSLGIATACLSNTNEPHWKRMAEGSEFPCVSALDLKLASQVLKLMKPDPLIFAEVERRAGVLASEVIFFDDSKINVDGALDAGWRAFLIDPSGDTVAQMRSHLKL